MTSLIPISALDGRAAFTSGDVTLSEVMSEVITSVSPFNGQDAVVSEALKSEIGAGFPGNGRATGKAGARVVWAGLGEALVIGPPVSPKGAAVVDQSDAWAHLALEGADAADVLARLTPLDLRDGQFKRGHAARSLLGHMTCLFVRTGAARYEMLVFRSMAQTAWHEISEAMESVAAQAALG